MNSVKSDYIFYLQGFTILVLLLSVIWTTTKWNSGTHKTITEVHNQGLNPFTITIIGLSSVMIIIWLMYVITQSSKNINVFLPMILILMSMAMSIVNVSTDRQKRGDWIGIITIVLDLLTICTLIYLMAQTLKKPKH